MGLRTPRFWGPGRGMITGPLLSPLSAVYRFGSLVREAWAEPRRPAIPLICVGNVVAGGAGKTPTVMALAELPNLAMHAPHFITRGYGGRLSVPGGQPVRVNPSEHDADAVGDEAMLLARKGPTWICRDRIAAVAAAKASGARLALLDDGFQNPTIGKTLSILVIDGAYGTGNGRVLPAGPLREPLVAGLARTDLVVLIGRDERHIVEVVEGNHGRYGPAAPIVQAHFAPIGDALAHAQRDVVAFAGIGRPDKLFATLKRLGCGILHKESFPDHHRYSRGEVERLLERAAKAGAPCITTAKDRERLPADLRDAVAILGVTLVFDDAEKVNALLREMLVGRLAGKVT